MPKVDPNARVKTYTFSDLVAYLGCSSRALAKVGLHMRLLTVRTRGEDGRPRSYHVLTPDRAKALIAAYRSDVTHTHRIFLKK